jgi:fatty-acid peroxygenase
MTEIPRVGVIDSSVALVTEGYEFISRRCDRLGTDVFETRLRLEPTICMRGHEAARLFYDEARFERKDAAPGRLRKTLFGEGGVQGLDDEEHRRRKAMFMSMMTPHRIDELVELVREAWRRRIPVWARTPGVVTLKHEAGAVLTEAVHAWAGVPLDPSEIGPSDWHLQGMIVGGAGLGPRYLWGRWSRARGDRAAEELIERTRAGVITPPAGTALEVIASHRDLDGALLDPAVAGVELLNVLRPTVAIDRYLVFAALALHRHPQWRARLGEADDATLERFVQEVRRTSPFFPFTAARVRDGFEWQGYRFPTGRLVLLDLFGTNHDPRRWDDPTAFRPERFEAWDGDAFDLIPQGGGDHDHGHRCAGEWITIEVMKAVVAELTRSMRYRVPDQDLRVARGRLPALPRSGFVIDQVASLPVGAAVR